MHACTPSHFSLYDCICTRSGESYIFPFSGSSQTSLPDILQFLTGANKLPATGLDKTPTIKFTDESCFPVASSCALSITFSRAWGSLQYDAFVEKMNYAILNSWGFGSV